MPRRADHADVLRLKGFLTRNGHPHQRFDPLMIGDVRFCQVLVTRNAPVSVIAAPQVFADPMIQRRINTHFSEICRFLPRLTRCSRQPI
jgi:hypothetical protein